MLESKRSFTLLLLATLLIKLLIAFKLPFTTDEAYFYIWGLDLEPGYYDHPPMVGWLFWLLQQVSHEVVWLRLPSVLLTSFIGWGIYRLVARRNEELGLLAGALYLTMPVNIYGILVSTDTTLVLWMFLSVAAFYLAVEKESKALFALSGVFLSLAVLSKYFVALLGFAYLVYFLRYERRPSGFLKLFIVYVMTLPALALMFAWNYDHCWSNYMFNFVNRHDRSSGFSLGTFFGYMLMWVYLLVPPAIYYLYQRRKAMLALQSGPERVFLVAFFIPITLFLMLSIVKVIGLHWVLGFYPFIFVIMGLVLNAQQLKKGLKVAIGFSVLHLLLLAVLLANPLGVMKYLKYERYYHTVALGTKPEVFLNAIEKYRGEYSLATVSYSVAAVMSFHAGENVAVIGPGSSHARHDDIVTDYRSLDGKNILVFYEDRASIEHYAYLFDSVRYEQVDIDGVDFHIMLGRGFHYARYHDTVLREIRKYYQLPKFLPKGECYFYQRYFPGEKY